MRPIHFGFCHTNWCHHLKFKWKAQQRTHDERTHISENYKHNVIASRGVSSYDEHAPLNIYTEETAWANESVVYNTAKAHRII